jgi:hypothetical protein
MAESPCMRLSLKGSRPLNLAIQKIVPGGVFTEKNRNSHDEANIVFKSNIKGNHSLSSGNISPAQSYVSIQPASSFKTAVKFSKN